MIEALLFASNVACAVYGFLHDSPIWIANAALAALMLGMLVRRLT